MADTNKHLVLVVEGTPTMGLYWQTILYDYLRKIIKYFTYSTLHISISISIEIVVTSVIKPHRFVFCDILIGLLTSCYVYRLFFGVFVLMTFSLNFYLFINAGRFVVKMIW